MADTIITDGNGNYKILKNGSWVTYSGPVPGATKAKSGGGGGKLSAQTEKFLNELSTQAGAANETQRLYEQAQGDINTLRPGPNRGRFLEMAIPEEGGGVLDTLGAVVVGGPARLLGAIDQKDVDAYQRLRGLQAGNVLTRQLEQKGPQTESDAARLALTELSPNKSTQVNKSVIQTGIAKTRRAQAKAAFYRMYANKWGSLQATTPHGYTVDQIWNTMGDRLTDQILGPTNGAQGGNPEIKIISRRKVR